jgi:hypothetical protein
LVSLWRECSAVLVSSGAALPYADGAVAAAELDRSRVGRKARRTGTVETVAPLKLPDA